MNRPRIDTAVLHRPLAYGLSMLFVTACGTLDASDPSGTTEELRVGAGTFQTGVSPTAGYAGTRDTSIDQAHPTRNAGRETVCHADGNNGGGRDLSCLIGWDVSSIPVHSTVHAASITVYVTDPSQGSFTLHAARRAWSDDGATWQQFADGMPWQTAGAEGSADRDPTPLATVAPRTMGSYRIDLDAAGVAAVQSWVDGAPNRGFVLADATQSDGIAFASSDATTPSQRPALTVSFTPPDAGTDAGTPHDAGSTMDAGAPGHDAGNGTDASTPHDAGSPTDASTPHDAGSPTDAGTRDLLVPAEGAVWGFYSPSPYGPNLSSMESMVGRSFDLVKRYHDFSNQGSSGIFPDASESAQIASGHILFFAWETRQYGTSRDPAMPAPAGAGNVYTYAQITSGQLDAYIDTVAGRIRAIGRPVFMGFNHEPDTSTGLGGSNVGRGVAGTAAEFVAAFRHLVLRFRADGATNAVWAVVYSGYQSSNALYLSLYPGDDVVDWIGWDPYTHDANNFTMPEALFSRFYDRIDAGMLGAGAIAKPRMLAEYGCFTDSRRPDWMRAIPDALRALPRIRVAQYFDSSAWGTFTGDAASTAGFATAGHDPYVNQPHP